MRVKKKSSCFCWGRKWGQDRKRKWIEIGTHKLTKFCSCYSSFLFPLLTCVTFILGFSAFAQSCTVPHTPHASFLGCIFPVLFLSSQPSRRILLEQISYCYYFPQISWSCPLIYCLFRKITIYFFCFSKSCYALRDFWHNFGVRHILLSTGDLTIQNKNC